MKLEIKEVEANFWEKVVFSPCAKAGLSFIPDLISVYSLDFVFNDFCVSSMHVNNVSTFIWKWVSIYFLNSVYD